MADQSKQQRLFLGCFLALVATAFGFVVRGAVLDDWEAQFRLSEEEKGIIIGVGLYPFAISIILFSLIIDRIGYGTAMVFAFVGHLVSTVLTIFAPNFAVLYIATFLYALANGTVEAVINPVVATIYKDNKTHWLNILHAGWPGGMLLAGLLAIAVSKTGQNIGDALPGNLWQWQMVILLIPILIYGALLAGLRFPTQERVEAGVSYREMLSEFGWGSAYIVSFLLIMGFSQILTVFNGVNVGGTTLELKPIPVVYALAGALIPTVLFAVFIHSFGRPMFVFLLLVMFLLATTELGTDGWIQDIIGGVLDSPNFGTLFLVYTASIMFVLRFFAGPIVHSISPLGLLAACAAIASLGLLWLGNSGTSLVMLLLAATLYGFGKTFFWPTTLGLVSEQYPRGGALLLNAIAGVGMISVGTIGSTAIGTVQDEDFNTVVQQNMPAVHAQLVKEKDGLFSKYDYVDKTRIAPADAESVPAENAETIPAENAETADAEKKVVLTPEQTAELKRLEIETKQHALNKIAILPAVMCGCYLLLIAYFRARGGYKAEVLTGHAADDEKFTGGVKGPVEA